MRKNNIKKYALILAGGNGSRLWPISTTNKPKQYLNLYSDNIMINETIKRIENLFEYDNIFVITNIRQKELAERYIDNRLPRENIIYEPISKNTAMCIFYASLRILEQKENGTITILSSDHYIDKQINFLNNIKEGIELANENENLVTIGIKPTYPATGLGYIKYSFDSNLKCNIVEEFKEKPVYKKAKEYVERGNYYWNSGIFIWKISTILNNYKKFLPEIYRQKEQIIDNIRNRKNILENIYKNIESISIDKGILEKTQDIKMIKGSFEWYDIGNINDFFETRHKIIDGNVKIGNSFIYKSKNSDVYNEEKNKLIVILGNNDINVINCNNVILVSNKNKPKLISEAIKKMEKDEIIKKFL